MNAAAMPLFALVATPGPTVLLALSYRFAPATAQ